MPHQKFFLVSALAGVAVVLGTALPAAAGATTAVVRPGQSIQAAVDRAAPGGTIVVTPGIYHENLVISKNGVRLVGFRVTLVPPAVDPGPMGICITKAPVVCSGGPPPDVPPSVSDVRVSGFTIQGFGSMGIFVFGGSATRLRWNRMVGNADYGVFANSSSGTVVTSNTATGSGEAGFYVGDSPTAAATLSGNSAVDNRDGFFIRNAEGVQMSGNTSRANCAGVVILADSPGPAGNVTVKRNQINDNTKACSAGSDSPPVSGIGLISLGGNDVTVFSNEIHGNAPSGPSFVSGGVVVLTGPGGSAPVNNVVRGNSILGNLPNDIIWDGTGSGNLFAGNACATSQPPGLCA